MAEEFEDRDLSDSVFWGVDLRRATFRDVNLSGVSISHALLDGVDIDAKIDRLVINGVDVTDYVNERDRWYPLRAMVRPADPEGARAAWTALEQTWAATIARADRLTDAQRHERVDGEWSFVETLRHLLFAMDKWFTAPILGEGFHPIGIPNSGSIDFPWPISTVTRRRRTTRCSRRVPSAPTASVPGSTNSRRPTLPARSRCSRTAS
jgi:hypothetical protein